MKLLYFLLILYRNNDKSKILTSSGRGGFHRSFIFSNSLIVQGQGLCLSRCHAVPGI